VPDGDVIVGHSMGGITASIVGARCGARVVHLASLLPLQLHKLKDLFGEMMCPEVAPALERRDGLDFWTGAETFGLDPSVLRGQALAPYFEELPAPVSDLYIGCRHDRVVRPDYQARFADVWLECGHEAMREQPAELARLLLERAHEPRLA
jgi:pimeloyl-ACP methyl ester carboxylesterase